MPGLLSGRRKRSHFSTIMAERLMADGSACKMKRLAFINCRTYWGGSGLIHMPFAFNALLKLQQDWRIDLFLGELPNSEYSAHFSPNVRVRNIYRALTRKWYLKEAELALRFVNHFGYSAVLALGQVGISVGNVLARLNRCPLIVFNDEFPSCFGYTRWADREAQGLRNASL